MLWVAEGDAAELTRVFTEIMRLGADLVDKCDGKRTSSCKNYNQFLNKLGMNSLCVALILISESMMFCESRGPDLGGGSYTPFQLY